MHAAMLRVRVMDSGVVLMIGWAVVTVLLILAEIATVNFVAIWFALGSLVSFIMSFFTDSFLAQLIVFVVVSIVFLIATKPIVKKYFNKNHVATNSDGLVGKACVVHEKIDNVCGAGRVTADGQDWSAKSSDESVTFEIGETAKIVDIQGVTLIVEKTV